MFRTKKENGVLIADLGGTVLALLVSVLPFAGLARADLAFSLAVDGTEGKSSLVVSSEEMTSRTEDGDAIVWTGHPLMGPDFRVRAEGQGTEAERRWRFSFANPSSGRAVREICFPRWTFRRTNQMWLYAFSASGEECRPDWSAVPLGGLVWKTGAEGARFLVAIEEKGTSRCLSVRGDTAWTVAQFEVRQGTDARTCECVMRRLLSDREANSKSFAMPEVSVTAICRGRWQTAVRSYRDWVEKQTWASAHGEREGWLQALEQKVRDSDVKGAAQPVLPGETHTYAPLPPDPFPDRMSAFVWRNWFLVPKERLAQTVGTTTDRLETVAMQMGLPRNPRVLAEWRRRGYITVLRRNWHLLDYPQLMQVLDMTRDELRFSLMEDDFLWTKVGKLKPRCGKLYWQADQECRGKERREQLFRWLKEEDALEFEEEPRFAFVADLSKSGNQGSGTRGKVDDPAFGLRLIFSYFADYGDALGKPGVPSYPEGLLEKLAWQGVNAVWLHTVLSTLVKDPNYPEFGRGSEARIEGLKTLVDRCARHGMRVYLYMNEPRAQPESFFEASAERREMRGAALAENGVFAMCTGHPETRRWLRDGVCSVFKAVPGLGGIFTISMSENLTNCGAKNNRDSCPRCRSRKQSELILEQNRALIEGMCAGSATAEAIVWNWSWPEGDAEAVIKGLPRGRCRVMAVSEGGMDICRGGVPVTTHDYAMSCVGPSGRAKKFWRMAKESGIDAVAKVQANTTWELSCVPYLPVMDLVAEHAENLAREGVKGVMLSWSLGCAPAPNLSVFGQMKRGETANEVLDRIACERYGERAVGKVRASWKAFSDGFRSYPFSHWVVYLGPMQWGPVNPLYMRPTNYEASMVGFPYDDVRSWCGYGKYPEKTFVMLMQKVADGFAEGCRRWRDALPTMTREGRCEAEREYGLFRAAALHFDSSADQVRFYCARDIGDMRTMEAVARRELARAKEELSLVRADSRIGFESSCQYYFVPQDIREKILSCRDALDRMGGNGPVVRNARDDTNEWVWVEAKDFGVEGRPFAEGCDAPYARIPATLRGRIPEMTYGLGRMCAGMAVRFAVDDDRVRLACEIEPDTWAFVPTDLYMTGFAQVGFDWYERRDGCWQYGNHIWPSGKDGSSNGEIKTVPGRPVLINFPIRCVPKSVRIGVRKGHRLSHVSPPSFSPKPIVHYGTSIVHGGCVSRPGLCFTAQAARQIDAEWVNLGFSGAARMEIPMCTDVLAKVDAALYIIDPLWNMKMPLIRERYEPFVRELRRRCPEVPILLCEDVQTAVRETEKGLFVRDLFRRLQDEGWKRLHLLRTDEMLPPDTDLTLDLCHPNDAGARLLAEAYARKVKAIFKEGRR